MFVLFCIRSLYIVISMGGAGGDRRGLLLHSNYLLDLSPHNGGGEGHVGSGGGWFIVDISRLTMDLGVF